MTRSFLFAAKLSEPLNSELEVHMDAVCMSHTSDYSHRDRGCWNKPRDNSLTSALHLAYTFLCLLFLKVYFSVSVGENKILR